VVVNNAAPFRPITLENKPANMDPINGSIITSSIILSRIFIKFINKLNLKVKTYSILYIILWYITITN